MADIPDTSFADGVRAGFRPLTKAMEGALWDVANGLNPDAMGASRHSLRRLERLGLIASKFNKRRRRFSYRLTAFGHSLWRGFGR